MDAARGGGHGFGPASAVPLIAQLMQVPESYVWHVIHDFNGKGFDALDPKMERGRASEDRSGDA